MTFRDYIVEYRSEQIIAEIANKIRNLRNNSSIRAYIRVTDFIKNELALFLGASFGIRVYMPEEDERQAYVSYNPLTLNVSEEFGALPNLAIPMPNTFWPMKWDT